MNVELLQRVATKLRRMRHPDHFRMESFAAETDCGTSACIAGHALLLAGYRTKVVPDPDFPPGTETRFISPAGRAVSPMSAAMRELKLTELQAMRLFHYGQWPREFNGGDDGWFQPRLYNDPKVAAARIERFIKTKGAE